jgi:hypothetical protein
MLVSRIAISIEERFSELTRRFERHGLRFPESRRSPGVPNLTAVARLIDTPVNNFNLVKGAPSPSRILLMNLVEKFGLMPIDQFEAVTKEIPDLLVKRDIVDEDMVALKTWCTKVRNLGLGVPINTRNNGKPYFSLIGRELGIPSNRISSHAYRYRATIEDLASEVGMMKPTDYTDAVGSPALTREAKEDLAERLQQVERHVICEHITPSKPLPESRKRGKPHYSRIFKNAGTRLKDEKHDAVIIRLIDEAAQHVGIGSDGFRPAVSVQNLTYGEFSDRCILHIRLGIPNVSASVINRFKSSLRKWQSALGKEEHDLLSDDFGPQYRTMLGKIGGQIQVPDSRRKWLRDMSRCYGLVAMYRAAEEEGLPSQFSGALSLLLRRKEHKTAIDFCRAADLFDHKSAIRSWVKGECEPTTLQRSLVHRIEDYFEVERNTLVSRIRSEINPYVEDVRVSLWPECLNTDRLKKLAKPLLPADWMHLSDSAREEIGHSIVAECETTDPFRLKMRSLETKLLAGIPPLIETQWGQIVEYKTTLWPRWPRETTWVGGTVDRNWNEVRAFLTFLNRDPQDGGLGIPVESLTLAYLACPQILQAYISWQYDRCDGDMHTGTRSTLGLFAHLTTLRVSDSNQNETQTKGFLQNVPEWAMTLRPVKGLLADQEVSKLQEAQGWEMGLQATCELARSTFKNLRPSLTHGRDPFLPILPILDRERPLDALNELLEGAYAELPDPQLVSEYRRAIAVRRFVTLLIVVRTALRRKNIGNLTFTEDHKSMMRRTDECWTMEIPSRDFKNRESPFFGVKGAGNREKTAFIFSFRPCDNEILDEYVNTSRPILLKNAKSQTNAYFVSKNGKKLDAEQLTSDFYRATWSHLVYHKSTGTGIPGVECFGVHAVRDIVATHILKTTGDVALAADALQDTPQTVLAHYARFLTRDRTKRVTDFLQDDLPDGSWGGSPSRANHLFPSSTLGQAPP